MKQSKWVLVPLVLTIALMGLLFVEDKTPLYIVSQPSIYSSYQTSESETIAMPFLTTQAKSYVFSSQYISSANLTSQDAFLPLRIVNIETLDTHKTIDSVTYTLVVFYVQPRLSLEHDVIQYEDASLEITYDNTHTLKIPIGEFNYVFKHPSQDVLTLGHLSATSEDILGINTMGGVLLELGNQTQDDIFLESIEVLSSSVHFNQGLAQTMDQPLPETEKVDAILNQSHYDFFRESDIDKVNQSIPSQGSLSLYLPLIYAKDIHHIGRFSIKITYLIDGVEHAMYLDDFPFRRYDLFDESLQESWVIVDGPK